MGKKTQSTFINNSNGLLYNEIYFTVISEKYLEIKDYDKIQDVIESMIYEINNKIDKQK